MTIIFILKKIENTLVFAILVWNDSFLEKNLIFLIKYYYDK